MITVRGALHAVFISAASAVVLPGQDAVQTSIIAIQSAPEPTVPPLAAVELLKRRTNTCGYVNGEEERAVTCLAGGSDCQYDDQASAIGCCGASDCLIWTACLPYVSSNAAMTADLERTVYCSDLGAPYCATYNYADPEWLGYTMVACYSVSTDFAFYASPFQATSTTTSSSSTTTTSTTTTSEPPIPPTPDPDPSVPVGPIVGGVVGGVAVIAAAIVAIFWVCRRKRRQVPEDPNSVQNVLPPTRPAGSGYEQHIVESKSAMPMTPSTLGVSPASPTQSHQSAYFHDNPLGPPPPFPGTVSPPQNQQQWSPRQNHAPVELPIARPDGELRELM